ncbi:MAG: ATP-binding protein [Oligoflexales bacterium]|nr:ATP-binding protein [Oligoflexales bacterium]
MECILDKKPPCCEGVGYRLNTDQVFTRAELCSCVLSCPACFGRMRKTLNGDSIQCRSPSPARIVSLINGASIPSRYATAKFDSFSNFSGNGHDIVHFMRKWLTEFSLNSSRGIVLSGGVGVGKTYLLAALAKNLAARERSVRFVDFMQLLTDLKASYANNKADDQILSPLIQVDVLIIDELGKGRSTDWEFSILDQLVMGRYNQNKIIVASTNYSLKSDTRINFVNRNLEQDEKGSDFKLNEFETLKDRVGERVFSRLVETSHFVELTGEDFRSNVSKRFPVWPSITPK